MFLYSGRAGRQWCFGIACLLGVVFAATPAFAQFDRGQISGVVKDDTGGVVPGATVTATRYQTQAPRNDRDRRERLLHLPQPARRPLQHQRRAPGLQEGRSRKACSSTPPASADDGFRAVDRRDHRERHRHGGADAAPDRRRRCARPSRRRTSSSCRSTAATRSAWSASRPASSAAASTTTASRDLGNGGFNINGSRSDENNITVDGATAIRTRSYGAIVGIQNVDAIQEVQVLTGDYMPEYGRASGGQIRMVTKSGSNRFSGSGSYFYARRQAAGQHLDPQQEPQPAREQRRRAVRLQAVRATRSAARCRSAPEGQAVLLRRAGVGQLLRRCRPTPPPCRPRKMRTGDFSELLERQQSVLHRRRRSIIDPQTGQPFPGNIIPAEPAERRTAWRC